MVVHAGYNGVPGREGEVALEAELVDVAAAFERAVGAGDVEGGGGVVPGELAIALVISSLESGYTPDSIISKVSGEV